MCEFAKMSLSGRQWTGWKEKHAKSLAQNVGGALHMCQGFHLKMPDFAVQLKPCQYPDGFDDADRTNTKKPQHVTARSATQHTE
jgi:hypothetical protein